MILGPPSRDRLRWAEALAIEKSHGSQAAAYVAQRIGALTLDGDETGVLRMREIAARLDQLLGGGSAA